MHFSTLLALTTLISLATACLTFDGTISTQIPRKIIGKLVDNGVPVCAISSNIDSASVSTAWAAFTCLNGHTAWIQTDGSRIGYWNGHGNFEFMVKEGKTFTPEGVKGVGKEVRELWAKEYGC